MWCNQKKIVLVTEKKYMLSLSTPLSLKLVKSLQLVLNATTDKQAKNQIAHSSMSAKVLWLGHFDPEAAKILFPKAEFLVLQSHNMLNTLATDFDHLWIHQLCDNSSHLLFSDGTDLNDSTITSYPSHQVSLLSSIQNILEVLQPYLKTNASILIYQEQMTLAAGLSTPQIITSALHNAGLNLTRQWGMLRNHQQGDAFIDQELWSQTNSPVVLAYLLAQNNDANTASQLPPEIAQLLLQRKTLVVNGQGLEACDAWFFVARKGQAPIEKTDSQLRMQMNLELTEDFASGVLVSQNWQILKENPFQSSSGYQIVIEYPKWQKTIECQYQELYTSTQAFYEAATSNNWSIAQLAQIVLQFIHNLDMWRPDFGLIVKLKELQNDPSKKVLIQGAACFYDGLNVGIDSKTGHVKSFITGQALEGINNLEPIDLRIYLTATILRFISHVPCFAIEIENRHYTRLQLVENLLSHLSIQLTDQDFIRLNKPAKQWDGNNYLPHQVDSLEKQQSLIYTNSLEQQLAETQTNLNGYKQQAQIELSQALENERRKTSQTYELTTSWRLTQPLRKLSETWQTFKQIIRGGGIKKNQVDVALNNHLSTEPRLNYRFWSAHFDSSVSPSPQGWLAQNSNSQVAAPVVLASLVIVDSHHDAVFTLLTELKNQHYSHWTCTVAVFNTASGVTSEVSSKNNSDFKSSTTISSSNLEQLILLSKQDPRIQIVVVDSVQDSKNNQTNAIFEQFITQTNANYFCVLQPTMRLRPQAFDVLLAKIHGTSNIDVVYSDIDAYLENGQRVEPQFKPDWNPELFYSSALCPQVLHSLSTGLFVIKRQYANSYLAKSSPTLLSSEFLPLSLLLHVVEQLRAQYQQPYSARISHIPLVLSHHLMQTLSQEQRDAASELLKLHFKNLQTDATVVVTDAGAKVVYPIKLNQQAQLPLVSIVIPTRNNKALLQQCIESIIHITAYSHYEIIVIDNGSTEETTLNYFNVLRRNPKIKVIRDNDIFNYSSLNNHAVALASGDFITLMNDDIQVIEANWLEEMLAYAQQSHIGVVGAKLYYPNYTIQHAGVILVGMLARHIHKGLSANDLGYCSRAQLTQNFSALTAACLMVKKSIYEQLKGLNSTDLTVGWNDIDFCLRVRQAGYENVWTPHAQLLHHESATRGQDISPEKRARAEKENRYMQKTWGDQMLQDPAYNSNLTDAYDDFSYAWPPRV